MRNWRLSGLPYHCWWTGRSLNRRMLGTLSENWNKAHARRRFDEAVKALPKAQQKSYVAYEALQRIQVIYHQENLLKDLSAEERLKQRQITVKPLVEAYFAWAHEIINDVLSRSKTWTCLNYSINQEKYLKVFLEDGEVPMVWLEIY